MSPQPCSFTCSIPALFHLTIGSKMRVLVQRSSAEKSLTLRSFRSLMYKACVYRCPMQNQSYRAESRKNAKKGHHFSSWSEFQLSMYKGLRREGKGRPETEPYRGFTIRVQKYGEKCRGSQKRVLEVERTLSVHWQDPSSTLQLKLKLNY